MADGSTPPSALWPRPEKAHWVALPAASECSSPESCLVGRAICICLGVPLASAQIVTVRNRSPLAESMYPVGITAFTTSAKASSTSISRAWSRISARRRVIELAQ